MLSHVLHVLFMSYNRYCVGVVVLITQCHPLVPYESERSLWGVGWLPHQLTAVRALLRGPLLQMWGRKGMDGTHSQTVYEVIFEIL